MSATLQDIATRLQVYLEGLKASEVKQFQDLLDKLEAEVMAELARGEVSDLTDAQITKMIARLNRNNSDSVKKAIVAFTNRLKDIAKASFDIEASSLKDVIVALTVRKLTSGAIWSRVVDRPMSATGELLAPWIQRMTSTELLAVESLIRRAYSEGWSNSDITKALRGTRANRYTDGMLMRMGRQNATIVRTAIQHANAVARQTFWEQNDDIIEGYRWVSTLDKRTSDKCRALDGKVFKIGQGPLPPIHPNCRSTTVAEVSKDFDFLDKGATRAALGGPVPAEESYYEWLKKQSAEFQDSVIGPTRGALLRNGGLTAAEFARLQLNSLFEPLTLEEMRQLAPLAFRKAGI